MKGVSEMEKVVAYPQGDGQWLVVCDTCGPICISLTATVDDVSREHLLTHATANA